MFCKKITTSNAAQIEQERVVQRRMEAKTSVFVFERLHQGAPGCEPEGTIRECRETMFILTN
jgi:hypothetical protein